MVCHSGRKHLHQGLLLLPTITNFLNLSNKNLVIVSALIHVHASGKQGEIKTVLALKRLHCTGAVLPKVLKVVKMCYRCTFIEFLRKYYFFSYINEKWIINYIRYIKVYIGVPVFLLACSFKSTGILVFAFAVTGTGTLATAFKSNIFKASFWNAS